MIRPHHYILDVAGIGVNQFPTLARVGATPQPGGFRVYNLWIDRIEYEKPDHAAQIEHSPRLPPIVGDIGTGHVAGDQNGIRIMRADGGIKHRPATARTYNLKIPRTDRESCHSQRGKKNQVTADVCHLMLSFS